jgi:hypothetical protein
LWILPILNVFLDQGELHFGSTTQYRKIEEEGGNDWIGDKNDGSLIYPENVLPNIHAFLTYRGTQYELSNRDILGLKTAINENIFCMTKVNIQSDLGNNESQNKFLYEMHNSILADQRYPKKVVFLNEYENFIKKVILSLDILGYSRIDVALGNILYDDRYGLAYQLSMRDIMGRGSSYWVNFIKEKRFAVEREQRLMIPALNMFDTEFGKNISIGSIRPFVTVYDNLSDFVDQNSTN